MYDLVVLFVLSIEQNGETCNLDPPNLYTFNMVKKAPLTLIKKASSMSLQA